MGLNIDTKSKYAAHRIFILLKNTAKDCSKWEFSFIYLQLCAQQYFDFRIKLSEIIKSKFGYINPNNFSYIGELYNKLRLI
jgi:hypothetical protein